MIPFVDLNAQLKRIEKDVRARMDAVLAHGQFILGPEIKELEAALASFAGVRHCITCASGTDALFMTALMHGLGPGDHVFTTPFTFFATAEIVALAGATPVFVDVDPVTFNIDPACLAKAIAAAERNDPSNYPLPRPAPGASARRARGILTVDLFGLPSDYDALHAIAREHGLWVVQDAAQSFGAVYRGKRAGANAEVSCTSFFPAKPLGCYGDGGAIFTDDPAMAAKLTSIRVHGQGADKYEHVRLGVAGRLDTLQAAVLMAKLAVFADELEARQRVADKYTELLRAEVPSLRTPSVPSGSRSAWAQYSLVAESEGRRNAIRAALQSRGIPTMIYYPSPLHLQKVFAGLGYEPGSLPVSEDLCRRIFSVPMHPYLTPEQIEQIVAALKAA
jgi:dTDP-4-amino-4,6-dideoxygalactose transaminase